MFVFEVGINQVINVRCILFICIDVCITIFVLELYFSRCTAFNIHERLYGTALRFGYCGR
jgi:hypothetical protein